MAGSDSATGRVTAVIMLLLVAGAGLRGYLPPPPALAARREDPDSPAWLILVAAALVLALAILVVAVINRMRDRRAVPAGIAVLPGGVGLGTGRPAWRVLLVGAAVLAAWLLISWLLARLLAGQLGLGFTRPGEVPGAAPPAGTVAPPTDAAPHGGGPPQHPAADAFGYLARTVAAMLVLTVVGVVGAVHYRRIRRWSPHDSGAPAEPGGPPPGPQSLARAAQLGLAEIADPTRDPRQAIIACYAAMERQLRQLPEAVPQDFDTPTEVLARAVARHVLPAANAARLVELFTEARFSAHRMTERHRRDAVATLALVLAELRSSACERW